MTGDTGGDGWGRPFKPPGPSIWIADHRGLVRGVFFLIDLAFLIAVVMDLVAGEVSWPLLLQVVIWSGLTWQAGWVVPGVVDRWRAG